LFILANSRGREKSVCVAPVFFKAQVMLDQNGAGVSVIADPIAVNRGIDNGQGQYEKNEQ
jgi:hypothetical protein